MKNYKNILELKAKQRETKERYILYAHTYYFVRTFVEKYS